jgi:hypothetical protein
LESVFGRLMGLRGTAMMNYLISNYHDNKGHDRV